MTGTKTHRRRLADWPVAAAFSLAALLSAAIVSLLAAGARRQLRRVEVAGDSMQPGLRPGDFVLLRLGAPRADCAAGMVVAFAARATPGAPPRPELMLKRIVGLPGELLRVGEHVEINGRILEEPYCRGVAPEASYRAVQTIPAQRYFVLGDSRAQSTDSRDFGEIAADRIVGQAIWRYWPPRRIGPIQRSERRWQASHDGLS